ncbi:MAG TPA: Wzz/FepE/Etk N-terminal domain-containing protein, partial [Segetibacter sp.]
NNLSFNLADIAEVLKRRKSFIVYFTLLSGLVAAAIVFFVIPPYYKSTAVVVAANPLLADKAHLYNDNVEQLYSTFGGEDDLNRLYGIAGLETTYKLLVDMFALVKYYGIEGSNAELNTRKAVEELRDDVDLIKNELYQLKISVTTKDKKLSASIANSFVDIVQSKAQDIWKKSYEYTLQKISAASADLEKQYNLLADSTGTNTPLSQLKRQGLLEQIQQNEKISSQLKIAIANNTPALIIMERAYPSAKADNPKKLLIIVATLLSALAFSIIAVLVFERRQ